MEIVKLIKPIDSKDNNNKNVKQKYYELSKSLRTQLIIFELNNYFRSKYIVLYIYIYIYYNCLQ